MKTTKSTRITHDYTNEVELKSLAIREKNKKLNIGEIDDLKNDEIDNLIELYLEKKDSAIKQKIIELSENVQISKRSHEQFGRIIILMIKKILTKPNFSGYSWHDEFYSDATYRVLKYIHNFNHKLKSKITGAEVSCFSYITQIIHNSIFAIINDKNKKEEQIKEYIKTYSHEFIDLNNTNSDSNASTINLEKNEIVTKKCNDLNEILDYLKDNHKKQFTDLIIEIPSNMSISYNDYLKISDIHTKNKFNLNIKKV